MEENANANAVCIHIAALLRREDAQYDREITIMRLGEVERMCTQSRVGEDRMAAGGGGRELQMKE